MASSPAPLLSVRDIDFSLGAGENRVHILKQLSLEVSAGEQVSIVGASGSGKTSLLMVLAGLERPNQGSIRIKDQELSTLDEDTLAQFRRDHMGIVFQNFHLISTMTALENVSLPLELVLNRAERKEKGTPIEQATNALTEVGLGHRLNHYPAALSGGEQQRVALARAFVGTPDLILADEPTGNLDHETGEKVIEVLFKLCRERQISLILVTHDRTLAKRCDRMVTLVDGKFTANKSNS